jgi:hypothetical protein
MVPDYPNGGLTEVTGNTALSQPGRHERAGWSPQRRQIIRKRSLQKQFIPYPPFIWRYPKSVVRRGGNYRNIFIFSR